MSRSVLSEWFLRARSGSVAVASGLIHLVLAGSSFASAAWLAVTSSGGRCSDTPSCLEVTMKLLAFNLVGYALAFAIWSIGLHRLLGSVSTNAARRTSSAAALQAGLGASSLLVGIAARNPWTSVAVAVLPLPEILSLSRSPLDQLIWSEQMVPVRIGRTCDSRSTNSNG